MEAKEKPELAKKEVKPREPSRQKQAKLDLAPPPAPPVTGVGPRPGGGAAGAPRQKPGGGNSGWGPGGRRLEASRHNAVG